MHESDDWYCRTCDNEVGQRTAQGAIDAQSSERMLRMVPVLTKKRVYVVKTGTIRKFVPALYCLQGNARF